MNLLKENNGTFSTTRVMSLICFIVFVYLGIFKSNEVQFNVLCLFGGLAFIPKVLQKFAEKKVEKL